MSTVIRPEVSKKNPHWISKHRYYELKHFCLQYNEWLEMLDILRTTGKHPLASINEPKNSGISDPTFKALLVREQYSNSTDIVRKAAKECSPDLGKYVFKGVTQGISYEHLVAQDQIPCCKDTYYDCYRKFFWLLSKLRK